MSLLLHISDTHFGTEKPHVVSALLALARQRRPDILVFSGDITQRARADEFSAARRFCLDLAVPRTLVLPGNHDLPLFNLIGRALRPYAGYLQAFGPRLEPAIDADDFLVLGVNTTRASLHKDGEVSADQVERVCRQLDKARPGQLRMVVTHQPAAVIREEDEPDRLRGAERALQAWSGAGADLVLGGHIHLPYVLNLALRATPTPRPTWCVQAGTAVSDRLRHGTCNSVNLIHWRSPYANEPRVCRVERCDYDGDAGAFKTASMDVLALGG